MPATTTLAFDIYGTLIDTQGIARILAQLMGAQSVPFAQRWREKQLEYSFRRGLMRDYQPFTDCTRQALEFCCAEFRIPLSEANRADLMSAYRALPAFDDALTGLAACHAAGYRVFAFSNGIEDDVRALLDHSGLAPYFNDVIGVDAVASFKPDPAVYAHFIRQSGSDVDKTWLISSNTFDVIGARNAGWQAAWVRRNPDQPFDPWQQQPNCILNSLDALPDALQGGAG
jgi:2-haloacid dehalogenase